jgi:hypothetical protein
MKRVRVILILAAVTIVAAGFMLQHREPRYKGRTLSEWLASAGSDRQAATDAVRRIGTNAIPWLLNWSVMKDSKFKERIVNGMRDRGFIPRMKLDFQYRNDAVTAFSMLGKEAKPAWPVLIQRTYSPDNDVRLQSCICLYESEPDNDTLYPVLKRLVTDPDIRVRDFAGKYFQERFLQGPLVGRTRIVFPPPVVVNPQIRRKITNTPAGK